MTVLSLKINAEVFCAPLKKVPESVFFSLITVTLAHFPRSQIPVLHLSSNTKASAPKHLKKPSEDFFYS